MLKIKMAYIAASLLIGSTTVQSETSEALTQTLYFGGDIITMEGDEPTYVEAVMERDGKIIYAGTKSGAVNNFAGNDRDVHGCIGSAGYS